MSAEATMGAYFDAVNAHDQARVAALLTEDAVEEHLDLFTATGLKQVVGLNKALWGTYDDLRTEDCRVLASGDDFVVFRATTTGTQTGPLEIPGVASFPASGNRVTGQVLCHLEVRDGKVARLTIAYNVARIFAQLEGKPIS